MKIGDFEINEVSKTFFIADIGANHDGDFKRAEELIYLAKQSGAHAAKFQHFNANTIVSDQGFKSLSLNELSHQANWKKSTFEVYKDASINLEWTSKLHAICKKAGIIFMTSPYSLELVDHVDKYLDAYKIGSGDITWYEIINHIASKQKPLILATGASSWDDIEGAVNLIRQKDVEYALLQCNTNYTANYENYSYINLNVLPELKKRYPEAIIGLSDHTKSCSSALGAVSLGAKIIEKHFTDSNQREGPDHKFALNPKEWEEMVLRIRELEMALGSSEKKIEKNEKETVIVQRRGLRANKDIKKGEKINRGDINVLRPCPKDCLPANNIDFILNKRALKDYKKGEQFSIYD